MPEAGMRSEKSSEQDFSISASVATWTGTAIRWLETSTPGSFRSVDREQRSLAPFSRRPRFAVADFSANNFQPQHQQDGPALFFDDDLRSRGVLAHVESIWR
jgi:hypothetical protein